MIQRFTFLSWFLCLLVAVVYPANQNNNNAVKASAPDLTADNAKTIQVSSNDTTPAYAGSDLIEIPQSLPTEAYVPSYIKDLKEANPVEGITFISAPTANNTGNAMLSFAMKLPEGRLGMQPELPVMYNNEGGSSWLGYGWNMVTPAISIDTRWGVPRYNDTLETEMYFLNGEQLAPVNNRSQLVTRTANKQFYPRVEGAFNKIIRHGNNPTNYWWEVTQKNGTRNFYGGKLNTGLNNSAVLKDDLGNIAYWALVETRDPNDNFVQYVYQTVNDVGVAGGVVPGRQIYVSEVTYTGNGSTPGAYKITFTRDRQLSEPRRKDVTIDARLGFKLVSADLLRKVAISFNNTIVRSYEFKYTEGAFYKSLLKSISELDNAGQIFYTHSLEYYDDVQSKQGYKPAAGTTTWNIASDAIKGDIVNPIPGFTGEGSALNTSKANSMGGGVAVTFGTLAGDSWSKSMSVGGGFQYGVDDEEGLVSMIDINGDGLPDKVFKKGGQLYYRANQGGVTNRFGSSKSITGATDFSTSHSKNIGGGVEVIPFSGFLGFNKTTSTTTSKIYFSDFNGDGLMDIASGGQVLFNHLNAQGDPTFDPSSNLTPSPVSTGTINKSFLKKDTALQAKQERDFPLQDIVRLWEAPSDGTINITAPLQLIDIPNPNGVLNTKKDGVRASIQWVNNILWSTVINANDHSVKTPANVNGLTVSKGQRIYFRVQSIYNGEDDVVSWDPVIEYTTPVIPSSDVHHKTSSYYQASADFILHNKGTTGLGKDGTLVIDGTFNKTITSDSVTVQINRTRTNITTTLFEKAYSGNELANGTLPVPGPLTVFTGDQLHFLLVSRSYIDRSAIQWQPHYAYVSFSDNTPVTTGNGVPTIQGFRLSIIQITTTGWWQPRLLPYLTDTVVLWPQVTGNGAATGDCWFTIKGHDTIYARRLIQMNAGTMSTIMDSIRLIRQANEPLFLEYAAAAPDLAGNLQPPAVILFKDSIFINAGVRDTVHVIDTLAASLYTNPAQDYLGPLFRGWGHFCFKGDKGDGPLDETKLNLDELNGYPTDPNIYNDSASISTLQNPSKTNFIMLFGNGQRQLWAGYDTSVYVTGSYMSSSRLGLHDVSVDSLMGGQTAPAGYKVSTTDIESFSAGVSIGPVGGSYGTSRARTTISLDMMDLNGDRYPDVLNDEMIQYTSTTGGLANEVTQIADQSLNTGWSEGFTLGGTFLTASTGNSTQKGSVAAQKTAGASAGLSGSVNNNDDECVRSWMDINGDGLIDRIYNNGNVALNLGYRFAPLEQWGLQGIDRSKSLSIGAGLGFNYNAGSFEGGFGLSRTTGDNSFLLNDVNGDGLPDQLSMSNGVLMVRLNTGSSFGPVIPWNSFYAITSNVSTGESINAAFTITIPIYIIFFKIGINPSGYVGHGVSRQQDMVMDIDGDGFADMLHSDNDGHLTASASTIGRTNMLRTVKGPVANSYFSMDYERLGNTYGLPQTKWVLKNVEVFDGVPGNGVDTMRYQYNYEGGYHDRHEREFYGFKKVISRELNTAANNQVYRSRIQQYLNTTYYNKGLLASEWLEDAGGNKYTQTNYFYDLRPVQSYVQFPALIQTQRLFYEGAATAGMQSTVQYDYDVLGNVIRISDGGNGSQQDMAIADITYHNLSGPYIMSVPAGMELTTVAGLTRKHTTVVNNIGNITKVSQFLANGTSAETDMAYNAYGNVIKITRPANYKGQRMWYEYEYDAIVHNYITKVTDAFGYASSSTYDYGFGALTGIVSRNNEQKQYKLDNRGRLISYTGPHELAAGKPYTIAYTYNTQAAVPYAVAAHYDPENNGDIYLISLADGLGRTIQVKKQVALFKGKGIADEVKLAIPDGSLYDAFGRITQTYYAVTEPLGAGMVNLNTNSGSLASTITYDVLDRPVKTRFADGATNSVVYSLVNGLLSAMTTDALNNRTETQIDTRNRQRYKKIYGPNGTITTQYDYNALNELKKITDTKGNTFEFTNDNLGRKVHVKHPDAGSTDLEYDLAGNLLKKITPQIKKEIAKGGAIQYQYDYERLTDIDYPRQYQNKVRYTYGKSGTGSKAGRLILQEDASGGQELFYGKQGEIIKVIRTLLISPTFATTYVSEQVYDTWHRIKKITYPDGEEVRYRYNKAGGLYSMEGYKLGNLYKYADQLGYDEYDQRIYMRYGNGTESSYKYDSLRRRLTELRGQTAAGRVFMNNSYSYDVMGNITDMVNNVQTPDKLPGGYTRQQYQYDNTYRLTGASGEHKGTKATGYTMTVAYDNLYNIVHKTMQGVEDHEYDQAYDYSGPAPHQVMQIGGNSCKYDLNGNQLLNGEVESFWDEENRLMAVLNKGVLSQYTYDGSGNRAVKSNGGIQGIWLNGAPAGAVKHNDNYTAYVSPFIECTRTGFVKHYFAENQRIVTKPGHGKFTNITFPTAAITAGNIDYGKRVAQIEQSRIDYYASLGVSPGPPTDKTYWARPENSGIAAPVYTDSTANMVPRGWPGNTTRPPTGPPVFTDPVPSNDSVKAGYGFQDPGHLVENSQFFYHPDQSGNTSFISNTLGEVSMHVAYSPLGETFTEDHTGSYTTSYLFNARERDAITGNYYYGPRYYEPESSQWLSVADPLGENAHTDIAGFRRLESASTNKKYSPLLNTASTGSTVSTGSAGNPHIVYAQVKVAEEQGSEKQEPKQSPKATTPKNKQLQGLHDKYKRGGRLQTRNALQSNANFFRNASPANRKK